jgi:GNAT superfamily N-acetyltransferase
MRAIEFITESQVLTERGSSVLFHYTSTPAAKKILSSGNFELASVVGNRSEEKYAPEGYPYFLSLTRTVTGDYHRWVGTGAVLFKLDGDWFNSRYIVKPIDYWERSWLHSDGTRTREAEDRVFSKEATIPNNAITEVHVLLKEQHEFRSPETRQLMILAKQQTLPVYLYTDEQAWRLLDKRRATTPSAASSVLRGAPAHGGSSRKPTDYVKPWIELIEKNKREQLSDRAQRLLKNIMYYSRDDEDNNMGVDLSNARKPNAGDRASAVELIGYLQKNGYGNNTVKLKNDLVAKWNPIWAAAEKTKQGVTEHKTSREEFEGMTIEMVENGHVLVINALDDWGNNVLGTVAFNIGDDNELDPQDLKVDERYQGQGIARAMYDYAKSKGYTIHRSYDQTDAGKGFWDKHRGEDVRIWEAFDNPYKTKSEKSEFGDVDMLAKLPDGTNLSIMFNQEDAENDTWGVEFYRNNSQEVTGKGDAQRVFATVLNAIQKFIKKNKPQKLFFSASKEVEPEQNSESRAKLYDRLVLRYAKAWGYRAFRADTGTLVRYELSRLQQGVAEGEDKSKDLIANAILDFYQHVGKIHKDPVDNYIGTAKEMLSQVSDPKVKSKILDIFKQAKQSPYVQGGVVTTIGALLAGGVLSSAQKMGLTPAQTNLALQAILNTVIPTVVSRINGKSWSDTIKYTLASAGIGTGIAGMMEE